jgi:exopolyphosphatase / guanosine-5'-triphosphate,3'-diphosphate pyrophosphatase
VPTNAIVVRGRPASAVSDEDYARVEDLLGHAPRGDFGIVVRDASGVPVVIHNAPFLHDGTPMPTSYWLVGREARTAVDRLEAAGGVRAAEAEVDAHDLERAHETYAAERDRDIAPAWDGARPSGGVGGTRRGVKCLHAHYAWYLAGGDDPVGRWVAKELERGSDAERSGPPLAAVDCGTNSTRLLVAYAGGPVLESLNHITRLGQGVDKTRRLLPEAIRRTVDVLRTYREVIDEHGIEKVRMTATSAARDAENSDDFFLAAEAVMGFQPELLEGKEEGKLSFMGATAGLDPETSPWLVVDIGGGSTEIAVGPAQGGGPVAVRSLDIGCVRLTERFLPSDPPKPDEIDAARRFVAHTLRDAIDEEPSFRSCRSLIGVAGTVSCLSGVDQGLAHHDRELLHHHRLSYERVLELLSELGSATAAERRLVVGIEPARVDVIVGGTLVLAEVMRALELPECLTSEADILDGLIMSMA